MLTRTWFSSEGWTGEGSVSKLAEIVGRIYFLATLELEEFTSLKPTRKARL